MRLALQGVAQLIAGGVIASAILIAQVTSSGICNVGCYGERRLKRSESLQGSYDALEELGGRNISGNCSSVAMLWNGALEHASLPRFVLMTPHTWYWAGWDIRFANQRKSTLDGPTSAMRSTI